jgi:hypothetical protein
MRQHAEIAGTFAPDCFRQAYPAAAAKWATYWQLDIARYLVASQEVTSIPLTEASAKDRSPADAIERR